jgi:hypothetical protein
MIILHVPGNIEHPIKAFSVVLGCIGAAGCHFVLGSGCSVINWYITCFTPQIVSAGFASHGKLLQSVSHIVLEAESRGTFEQNACRFRSNDRDGIRFKTYFR